MKTKVFEIRDDGTHIGVFCIRPTHGSSVRVNYELSRCGFPENNTAVIYGFLDGERNSSADPYHWGDRTNSTAHHYITDHWNALEDGQVIDVRVILGERDKPVVSDRLRVKA